MRSDFNDHLIDSKLHINTTGRNDRFSDAFLYPYEATSYTVLDRLIESGLIKGSDILLDYGSGKGRVPIYLRYKTGCQSIGVEIMSEFYEDALYNLSGCCKVFDTSGVSFIQYSAQKYTVPDNVNRVFFFNPFSIEIFKSVIANILDTYYRNPRHILFFFYYPQDEYIVYLSSVDEISFYDEIDCTDLFPENDSRNRIMIFELSTG